MKIIKLAVVALCCASTGCATIFQGTHEDITVLTSPDGAHCEMNRKGRHLDSIETTPGLVEIKKTKDNILVTCGKAGYQNGHQLLHSGVASYTFGNFLVGGLIGWGVDSATGADNEYPEAVNINLVPIGPGNIPPIAPASTTNLLPPNS
jgi:hypothetical protein